MVTAAMKLEDDCFLAGKLWQTQKSKGITLQTKVHTVKAMIFPVVMYGCESWTIKKAEQQKVDAFELWCSRRLLRVPWKTRRSNQSILKEINPENSLEGLMLKLKLQYFGHLMQTADSLEKTLKMGKTEGKRGQQRMRWLDGIPIHWTWTWTNSGKWSRTWLGNWTTTISVYRYTCIGSEGLPWWLRGKESSCQCRRHTFDPWSEKIPHAAAQPSPRDTTIKPVL